MLSEKRSRGIENLVLVGDHNRHATGHQGRCYATVEVYPSAFSRLARVEEDEPDGAATQNPPGLERVNLVGISIIILEDEIALVLGVVILAVADEVHNSVVSCRDITMQGGWSCPRQDVHFSEPGIYEREKASPNNRNLFFQRQVSRAHRLCRDHKDPEWELCLDGFSRDCRHYITYEVQLLHGQRALTHRIKAELPRQVSQPRNGGSQGDVEAIIALA